MKAHSEGFLLKSFGVAALNTVLYILFLKYSVGKHIFAGASIIEWRNNMDSTIVLLVRYKMIINVLILYSKISLLSLVQNITLLIMWGLFFFYNLILIYYETKKSLRLRQPLVIFIIFFTTYNFLANYSCNHFFCLVWSY